MSARKSRLQRKARRVVANERESEVELRLGKARAECDKALHEANEIFRKGTKQLQTERAEARKAAREVYEKERATILKAFANEEQAA